MKVKELFQVMTEIQKITLVNKEKEDEILYDGIKAGCSKEYSNDDVFRIETREESILVKIEHSVPDILTASNEELLTMFLDEEDLDTDIDDLEKKLIGLASELNDIIF